ncbi:hypothetical protein Tco_1342260, partial [Tanacetum coccineum]
VIGPAMPTPELLAAAAKLTEIGVELREAKVGDDVLSIGSPPPTIVNETASANDAECFEEVTRIMRVDVYNPYDVVGVDRNMVADNFKKRQASAETDHHPCTCIWEIVSMLSNTVALSFGTKNAQRLTLGVDVQDIVVVVWMVRCVAHV